MQIDKNMSTIQINIEEKPCVVLQLYTPENAQFELGIPQAKINEGNQVKKSRRRFSHSVYNSDVNNDKSFDIDPKMDLQI